MIHRLTFGYVVALALALTAVASPPVAADQSAAAGTSSGLAPEPAAEGAADTRPAILNDVAIEQRLGRELPLDLVFRDESGRRMRLGDFFHDRPVILSLAYFRCPMLCGVVQEGLASAMRVLAFEPPRDFEVVTVSFDPSDTPERAKERKKIALDRYRHPGAEEGWHFLTGDAAQTERLAREVGFRYAADPASGQYAHAAGIIVLTPRGKIARVLYGVEFSPRDLRLALVEASESKIGSPVDQLLLFCFHYDPTTGRYGAIALRSVRAGGALTVVALAGFVLWMLRRESVRGGRARTGAALP